MGEGASHTQASPATTGCYARAHPPRRAESASTHPERNPPALAPAVFLVSTPTWAPSPPPPRERQPAPSPTPPGKFKSSPPGTQEIQLSVSGEPHPRAGSPEARPRPGLPGRRFPAPRLASRSPRRRPGGGGLGAAAAAAAQGAEAAPRSGRERQGEGRGEEDGGEGAASPAPLQCPPPPSHYLRRKRAAGRRGRGGFRGRGSDRGWPTPGSGRVPGDLACGRPSHPRGPDRERTLIWAAASIRKQVARGSREPPARPNPAEEKPPPVSA